MGKPATLADWAAAEKAAIDAFVAWWLEGEQITPTDFPLAMPLGEWDEQYRFWGGD